LSNDNGGAVSRIAPVLRPGGTVPPLFAVTFKDGTAWDWSSGAVPAAQLANIATIQVRVTSESSKPDNAGRYARTTLSTSVNVARIQ
jgi:hypothetical protein